jgi:gas vesicle protein
MNDAPSHGKHAKPNAKRDLRQTATNAIDTTGESLRDFAGKAASGIEANPISALVGGIALGAVAAAFVPRTAQEARLLAPVGQRLSDTALGAIDAAKDTAKTELGVLGLSRDSARSQVSRILEGVLQAVSTAGVAALTAANDKAAAKKAPATE